MDKEVAAHLLLDLSKTQQEGETEDQQAARIIAIETARNVVDLQQAQQGAVAPAGGAKPVGGDTTQRRRPSLVRQQAEDISDDKSMLPLFHLYFTFFFLEILKCMKII